jgi:hypothetical protein
MKLRAEMERLREDCEEGSRIAERYLPSTTPLLERFLPEQPFRRHVTMLLCPSLDKTPSGHEHCNEQACTHNIRGNFSNRSLHYADSRTAEFAAVIR